jgi:hypothetical protein
MPRQRLQHPLVDLRFAVRCGRPGQGLGMCVERAGEAARKITRIWSRSGPVPSGRRNRHIHDASTAQVQQLVRGKAHDRVRSARGGPDLVVLEEICVDENER